MPTYIRAMIMLGALLGLQLNGWAQGTIADDKEKIPTLTVNGRGEVMTQPDEAVVRLGALAQDRQASAAQTQVNQVIQNALDNIKKLNVPDEQIRTAGLSIQPIYEPYRPNEETNRQRIIGYRASNTIEVRIRDLKRVGEIIDAGIQAGANNIEGISFQLRDDTAQRQQALRLAVKEARLKADAIAEALGVRLEGVHDVTEGGVQIYRPQMEFAAGRAAMAQADMATPVQPGQVQVDANVTVRYRIAQGGAKPAQ